MNNSEIVEQDLSYIWHPCTQMKDHEFLPMTPIKSAKGVYLYDFDGNEYIDAISSWWVNIFGHTNEYINSKVIEQVNTLEHVILAGFTHKPAVDLARRLVEVTPKGLNKVFFADNGSSAIEVALKMSFHAHKNSGEVKKTFVSLSNSYHGETLGALAVGDVELYKDTYQEIMIRSEQIPVPKDMSDESALEAIEIGREYLEKNADEISAVIIEPLVQCAGSMHMYSPLYIKKLSKICKELNIHLIADEVAVGFGRTGKLFACEHAEVTPDFIVLSKGLTGGYLPLSVVLTKDEIYQKFYCDYNDHKAFLHSHSYTGNALGCAAANAVLDIFENDNIIEKMQDKISFLSEQIQKFKDIPYVKDVRQTGMIAAIELEGFKAEERIGLKVYQYGLKHGVLLRPLGPVVYFMTPYIITDEDLKKVIDVAYDGIMALK